MDFETISPRTCNDCKGVGYTYWGDESEYEVKLCESCNGVRELNIVERNTSEKSDCACSTAGAKCGCPS